MLTHNDIESAINDVFTFPFYYGSELKKKFDDIKINNKYKYPEGVIKSGKTNTSGSESASFSGSVLEKTPGDTVEKIKAKMQETVDDLRNEGKVIDAGYLLRRYKQMVKSVTDGKSDTVYQIMINQKDIGQKYQSAVQNDCMLFIKNHADELKERVNEILPTEENISEAIENTVNNLGVLMPYLDGLISITVPSDIEAIYNNYYLASYNQNNADYTKLQETFKSASEGMMERHYEQSVKINKLRLEFFKSLDKLFALAAGGVEIHEGDIYNALINIGHWRSNNNYIESHTIYDELEKGKLDSLMKLLDIYYKICTPQEEYKDFNETNKFKIENLLYQFISSPKSASDSAGDSAKVDLT